VGAGTALFLSGWCFCPDAEIRSLALVVNGQRQPLLAFGMPRRDLLPVYHPRLDPAAAARTRFDPGSEDPQVRILQSGFWGIAKVGAEASGGRCEVMLQAELHDGRETTAELGSVPTVDRRSPLDVTQPNPSDGPFVAICLASYEPPLELFERQLESIRAQTHRNWVCVISDDCSPGESFASLREIAARDDRFVVSRSASRLGIYLNFEHALSLVPTEAQCVALADQDDEWHPDKLRTLLADIGDARLAYSDARIVRDGQVLSETYWSRRRNNYTDLFSLLLTNSVTGAASLFRSDLLDYALPFPPAQFAHFHDHWIALTALALGEIAFTSRPLYDYVQHGQASLGHAAANRIAERGGATALRHPRLRIGEWRGQYFADVCRLMQFATVLEMRCGERVSPTKRGALERFLRADSSLSSIASMMGRGAREFAGRSETLGAERGLSRALLWRRLVDLTNRRWLPDRAHLGATPPPELTPRPGSDGLRHTAAGAVADKIAPLELAVDDDAPSRVNILIPTIDLEHFFGGYIAKLNLARRLAERGIRVRLITVDPVGPLPPSWTRRLESYSGLAGVFDEVEVAFGRESTRLEISRTDRFIATTWWTAHIAHSALALVDADRFVYLTQEYEPFTFPMGTYAALAQESYAFPHCALFSTELLRDYFRRHAIGVYASGVESGNARSAAFENAITAIEPPGADELSRRTTRRLLFYSRPESHAARNMFELGVLAIRSALARGAFQGSWELHGIGTLASEERVPLGSGRELQLLPRSQQRTYAEVLRGHDVGLALMYTPHPSLVPIEMASAGMLTVTNSFENKTPERMAEISTNLITVEPTIDGVAGGLAAAARGVEDVAQRLAGSAVRWSRDWDRSISGDLLDRLVRFLDL
jgi:glycosyltransferase involved in cell wall biosynthesis